MRSPIAVLVAVAALAVATGCGEPTATSESPRVSTLQRTLVDADGDGRLETGPGEPLRPRRELVAGSRQPSGPARRMQKAPPVAFVQLTDLHIRDEESPARVPFLDRFGDPFSSTFRPHEALSHQVAAAAVTAVNRLNPQAVVVTGDLLDSAQVNELDGALAVLDGGRVRPDSGARGYDGVQEATNPDPLYYRPDSDAPRHPGLLDRAQRDFRSPGLAAPWLPVLGNHDVLVQGEVAPTPDLEQAARGRRAIEALEARARIPDAEADSAAAVRGLLDGSVPTRDRRVPADPRRRHVDPPELARRFGRPLRAGRLDYTADIGQRIRALVLDTTRRDGGSGGTVSSGQVTWLEREVRRRGTRWAVVFSHHPLDTADGGQAALDVLDAAPRVAAAVSGHRHRNVLAPRRTSSGGYWLVGTASLADFPQQARAFRLREDSRGGAVLETWMVDHAGGGLAGASRALSFLDVHGGRPRGFRGRRGDRNAALQLAP